MEFALLISENLNKILHLIVSGKLLYEPEREREREKKRERENDDGLKHTQSQFF